MAEALGLVASLIAINQAVAAVPLIIDALVSIAHTSDELADLLNELETIRICGVDVDRVVRSMSTAPGSDVQEPPSLRATRAQLEAVLSRLTELTDSFSGAQFRNGKTPAAMLKWLLRKNKIARLRNETREARRDLHLAISILFLEKQHAQGGIVLDIHSIVTESAQSLSSIKSGLSQNDQRASEASRLIMEQNLTLLQTCTAKQTQTATDASETATPKELIEDGIPNHAKLLPRMDETSTTDLMTTQEGLKTPDEQPRTNEIVYLSEPSLRPERDSVVRVNATVHIKCTTSCRCQCHVARKTALSPSWIRPILGSVLMVYRNLPILGFRPCNEPHCQNASSLRLNYRFPAWFWNRAVVFTAALANLSDLGASLHLRIPRVIYPDDNLWTLIIKKELSKIKMAFSHRLYSPMDVGQSGNTILHWSLVRREFATVAFLMEQFLDIYRSQDMEREKFQANQLLKRSEYCSNADKELLKKVAFLHGDDTADNDPFGRLTNIQLSALGIGDMNTALKEATEGLNDRDNGGYAPLHHVCQRSDVEGLRLLLDAGAYVDVRNDFGSTPLMIASQNSMDCVKLLAELGGCNVDARDCPGRAALHYATDAPKLGANEIMKYLLSANAAYTPTHLGRTPLHFLGPDEGSLGAEFIEEETSRRLEALLQFGASLDEVDGSGRTAVHWAIREEKATALKVLIRAGARLDGYSLDAQNVLHYAAMYGNQKTIAVLREAEPVGLDVTHRDKYGCTPEDCLQLRKSGKSDHWARVRIQSREEEDAIRELFQEIRERSNTADSFGCKSITESLKRHNSSGALRLLAPLIEQRRAWKRESDIKTLEAIAIQIREGMFDAAIESLDEVVELWSKGEEIGSLVLV